MTVALVETKLGMPLSRAERVLRWRLLGRLTAGLSRKLTLFSAPAGFGKTTLAAEWLRSLDRPCAWLSLGPEDNDPARFLSYLIAALQTVEPTLGRAARELLGAAQLPPVQAMVTLLLNDIAAAPRPFVLALDDCHLLQHPRVQEVLQLLVADLPPSLHLVLIARQDPQLPLPRLRVREEITDVGAEDLRFTTEETADFLRRALGCELETSIVDALQARTEGWAAGLQLAALTMRARPKERIAEFVQQFSGSDRRVVDYLAEEVVARQSEEVRTFLQQTCILDRLCAGLCDAVTGRADCKQQLRQLEQANLFLVPLDERRHWYRYHRLLADYMRAEQREASLAPLHARASRWLMANGLPYEAVRHALSSGDMAEATGVIRLAAEEAFREGSIVTLESWLDALPGELVRADSTLATYRGFVLFFTGRTQEVSAWAAAAERSLPADATPAAQGRLHSLRAHIALAAGNPEAVVRHGREALACLDPGDAVHRNLVLNLLGQVLELKGDVAAAAQLYREAADSRLGVSNELGIAVVLLNLVFALNELGCLREALVVCRRPARPGPVSEALKLAQSLLSYEVNDLELARRQATEALDVLQAMSIVDGELWGQYILGRVYLARGELGEVRRVAEQGRLGAARADVYEGKRAWFPALQAQAALEEGDLAAVARWAQAAGLSASGTPHPWDELRYFTYARFLLAQGDLEQAQALLSILARSAEDGRRYRKLITIHLLRARVQQVQGHTRRALEEVEKALRLAAPEGYLRAFMDEGPVIMDLLRPLRHLAPAFVDQVLGDACSAQGRPGARPAPAAVEPLSEREQQILRLIAAGHSNPEIAALLYLSPNTVKWHLKSLYGKLRAGNRVEAVGRAQELHLL